MPNKSVAKDLDTIAEVTVRRYAKEVQYDSAFAKKAQYSPLATGQTDLNVSTTKAETIYSQSSYLFNM